MKLIRQHWLKLLLALTALAAIVFSCVSLGRLDLIRQGPDLGTVSELTSGWSYTVNDDPTHYETNLPATLALPADAQTITLTNTLPDTVGNGDILRFQSLLGWYRIYIADELRLEYGNPEQTERYLLENASNMLPIKLRDEDAGQALRVETGFIYTQYLAQQRAPTLSDHRDLMMQDLWGSTASMVLLLVLLIVALVLFLLWFLFLLKRQPKHILAGCALFLFMGLSYYNVGNTFQCEVWGYPDNLPMYNDFTYYMMEFLIPVVGYQLILSASRLTPSKPLRLFVIAHTFFACAVIGMQMLWIGNLELFEYISAVATVIGYVWLWRVVRPLRRESVARKLTIPVFVCILAYLMDYYKLAGPWWPIPEAWVTYLKMELPFMAFLPFAMLLFVVMVMLALVEMLVNERTELRTEADMARFQVQLSEREHIATMENIAQIRQVRHDINHHLTVLSALAEREDWEKLRDYIRQAGALMPSSPLSEHNFVTSSILSHYRMLAEDAGIAFESNITYDENMVKNKTHLGILLGNALKNALEGALEVCGTADCFISMDGRQQGKQLILVVKNSFGGVLDENYRSTKGSDRGLGLAGMRGVTEQHDGYLELSHTDDVFTLKAVLVLE